MQQREWFDAFIVVARLNKSHAETRGTLRGLCTRFPLSKSAVASAQPFAHDIFGLVVTEIHRSVHPPR